MNELFELMEQYSLTLRRLNDKTITTYRPIPNRPLKPNERLVEVIAKSDVSKEEFDKWQEKGYWLDCRLNNGFVLMPSVEEVREHESGWMVKQDKSHGSMQNWDKKTDFFGKTPEEAIIKAVEYITAHDKERDEKKKAAGLI